MNSRNYIQKKVKNKSILKYLDSTIFIPVKIELAVVCLQPLIQFFFNKRKIVFLSIQNKLLVAYLFCETNYYCSFNYFYSIIYIIFFKWNVGMKRVAPEIVFFLAKKSYSTINFYFYTISIPHWCYFLVNPSYYFVSLYLLVCFYLLTIDHRNS